MKSERSAGGVGDVPLRVALLLQDLEFGGTQRYATHLARHLDRRLFEPEVWVLRRGAEMEPLMEAAGVPVVRMSQSSWVGPGALANLALNLAKRKPDILYTLTVVPNIWGRLFGAVARVPVVIASWRSLYPKQHERLLWRLSARVICNANALKTIMVDRCRVDPAIIEVIPNPVDFNYFSPIPDSKSNVPTVLYVGRLVKEKDPATLVEGFHLVSRQVPEARFEIVGGGYLEQEVREMIARYSLEDRVTLIPGLSDVRPRLASAWVFAMASVMEASPNVILEAMSMELPVVAPSVGGIPELVVDGNTGFLFEAGDPGGLAEGIVRLIKDRTMREQMGRSARERILRYHTMERLVDATQQVFLDAAEEAGLMDGR